MTDMCMRKRKKLNRAPTAMRAAAGKLATHDAYLATVSEDKRAALQKLRRAIRSAAPDAKECISYGVPAFRLNGKLLVAYSAAAKHCSFYPGATVQSFKDELKDYDTGKGT